MGVAGGVGVVDDDGTPGSGGGVGTAGVGVVVAGGGGASLHASQGATHHHRHGSYGAAAGGTGVGSVPGGSGSVGGCGMAAEGALPDGCCRCVAAGVAAPGAGCARCGAIARSVARVTRIAGAAVGDGDALVATAVGSGVLLAASTWQFVATYGSTVAAAGVPPSCMPVYAIPAAASTHAAITTTLLFTP